jgi:hypothetical protein
MFLLFGQQQYALGIKTLLLLVLLSLLLQLHDPFKNKELFEASFMLTLCCLVIQHKGQASHNVLLLLSLLLLQLHYPFENKELFEANFPADFVAEGLDQTRGW